MRLSLNGACRHGQLGRPPARPAAAACHSLEWAQGPVRVVPAWAAAEATGCSRSKQDPLADGQGGVQVRAEHEGSGPRHWDPRLGWEKATPVGPVLVPGRMLCMTAPALGESQEQVESSRRCCPGRSPRPAVRGLARGSVGVSQQLSVAMPGAGHADSRGFPWISRVHVAVTAASEALLSV